jgi:hypothetical protein
MVAVNAHSVVNGSYYNSLSHTPAAYCLLRLYASEQQAVNEAPLTKEFKVLCKMRVF